MKKLALFIALATMFKSGFTQFQGSLTYETIATNKIVTVYSQNSTMARIDARIYPLKAGVPDSVNAKDQDPLIYDLKAGTQLTLHPKMSTAIKTFYSVFSSEKMMKMTPSDFTITLIGTEKVGNYNCKHFRLVIKKVYKDINLWITQDLGIANILVCPAFMYYTPGTIGKKVIEDAGGQGIVVKGTSGPQTINLVSYTKRTPPNSLFQVPSGYNTLDQTPTEQSILNKN
jgi:hypothetical protein